MLAPTDRPRSLATAGRVAVDVLRSLNCFAPRKKPRYQNLDPSHQPQDFRAILRWGVWDPLTGKRRTAPPGPPAPRVEPDLALIRDAQGPPRLTWLGHASFLGTLGGRSFLIDPVFSDHAGWLYRRHQAPGLAPEELPPLSAVLVTHNHYDHMDAEASRLLPKEVPVIVPLGLGCWYGARGHENVTELDWWQAAEVDGLTVTLVPARHWSRRGPFDINQTLWGGFVVEGGGRSVYHAGDSAEFDGFAEIGRRFPDLEAAMLPVGGYLPGWFMENNHMTPEQAGEAFVAVGARRLLPMHWGTFQLTDEPLSEPPERLRDWWDRSGPSGRHLEILAVGGTIVLEP